MERVGRNAWQLFVPTASMVPVKAKLVKAHHGQDGDDGAVHGHGDGHLVERNLVEEGLHVFDGIDGDA